MTRRCRIDPESAAMICVMGLVLALILIRSCVPMEWEQEPRPLTPPESLYK